MLNQDGLTKFRMKIRLLEDKVYDIKFDKKIEDEEEDDTDDDKNLSDEEYHKKDYDHLFKLLDDKSEEEIHYFIREFNLDSEEPLLEAIKSMPNFQEFLKIILLSDNEHAQFFSLRFIMLITYCDDIDFSSFADQSVLQYLMEKLNDDSFCYRLISLVVITNIIIQYNEVYEFFSQNDLAKLLIPVTEFRNDEQKSEFKDTNDREKKIFESVAYISKVITKQNLFKPEEAPIFWDTAIFIYTKGGETQACADAVAVFGYLAKNGYAGQFDDEMMENFKAMPCDPVPILESFQFFLKNAPNVEEFFADLVQRGIMDDIIDAINVYHCTEQNSEIVYMILGELKFVSEDEEFWTLTYKRLKGPFRIYTRRSIVYYLTCITYSTSTDLMTDFQNHDIFIDIDDLMSSRDKSIVECCLNFIEVLLNCYAKGFQKKPSTFPNAYTIQNSLNEIITIFDDQIDEQIERILELFK